MSETVHILVVEDNPGDARLLRELLYEAESFDFRMTHVDRLAEACQLIQSDRVDVILLDLSLPDTQGMETVHRMLSAAAEIPIIVLTGWDDDATALQAVQAGAQDFLVKGQVDGGVLTRAIRYARERKRLELERARLLESEREARATAEAAVRGRDEILRVVAHDLGNSLGAVLVTTTVLLRTLPEGEGAPAQARQAVQNIRSLVEQMRRLRQDLMDVALLEAGRLSVHPLPMSAESIIETALDRYTALAEERGIRLIARVDPDLPLLHGDEDRLIQVMDNLLTNALKFTPAGGEVEVSAMGELDGIRIGVRDSGPGIPPENKSHVFEQFWTTREGNPVGAGLGLAIARGIVEAHGGRIRVDSEVGTGSEFWFVIPAAQPSEAR